MHCGTFHSVSALYPLGAGSTSDPGGMVQKFSPLRNPHKGTGSLQDTASLEFLSMHDSCSRVVVPPLSLL